MSPLHSVKEEGEMRLIRWSRSYRKGPFVRTKAPLDWDGPFPSDVALKFPGADQPNILLSDRAEIEQAGYDRQNDRSLVFCTNMKKAYEYLGRKSASPGPIQESGGKQFFEVRAEGSTIEICKEP
jgi:hypothetical protein